jgi:hypothetical protein
MPAKHGSWSGDLETEHTRCGIFASGRVRPRQALGLRRPAQVQFEGQDQIERQVVGAASGGLDF